MNKQVPQRAEVESRREEAPGIVTLRLRLLDTRSHEQYSFEPGQFNMLYLHGVGEIPISISADPTETESYDHTIRAVGRVSKAMAALPVGAQLGLRGPFGRGWPLTEARGRDVVVVSGGLGCAPVSSVIQYILKRRADYGQLVIMQGVKHSNDMIWQERFAAWASAERSQVLLAANQCDAMWPGHKGMVTSLFDQARFDSDNCCAMMCGPTGMMKAAAEGLMHQGAEASDIYLSMERNMQCAIGHCGHCQLGDRFVCRQGPVFSYPEIQPWLAIQGV